jgi:hypothetical protein
MVGQDSKGKGKVADEHDRKEKITVDDELKGEKPIDFGSSKEGKKKKCIKKIVYYESNTSSSQKDDESSSSKQKPIKTTFNHIPFNY